MKNLIGRLQLVALCCGLAHAKMPEVEVIHQKPVVFASFIRNENLSAKAQTFLQPRMNDLKGKVTADLKSLEPYFDDTIALPKKLTVEVVLMEKQALTDSNNTIRMPYAFVVDDDRLGDSAGRRTVLNDFVEDKGSAQDFLENLQRDKLTHNWGSDFHSSILIHEFGHAVLMANQSQPFTKPVIPDDTKAMLQQFSLELFNLLSLCQQYYTFENTALSLFLDDTYKAHSFYQQKNNSDRADIDAKVDLIRSLHKSLHKHQYNFNLHFALRTIQDPYHEFFADIIEIFAMSPDLTHVSYRAYNKGFVLADKEKMTNYVRNAVARSISSPEEINLADWVEQKSHFLLSPAKKYLQNWLTPSSTVEEKKHAITIIIAAINEELDRRFYHEDSGLYLTLNKKIVYPAAKIQEINASFIAVLKRKFEESRR